MAKTDSFFIRAKVDTDGVNFNQAAIDLGSYVDALGKSVLRIHNISVQYGNAGEFIGSRTPNMVSGTAFQLTTQSQINLVGLNDRSVVASGSLNYNTDAANAILSVTETMDAGPQHWTKGYLIGVEQMYFGVDQGTDSLSSVSIVMECTVETLTQSGAMALALSQQ